MRSRGPPSASSTVSRDAPKPVSASRRASAAGPSPSEVSASTRAPGCRCGRTRSRVRPCSETQRRLRQRPAEPRGGQAERGRRRHHQRFPAVRSGAPAPRRPRSGTDRRRRARRPARPRCASTSSTARSNGLGHGRAAPRISGAARPRWRLPPNTISAPEMSPRAAGLRPSTPSSPMPTMDSQRRGAAVSRRERISERHARILILGGTTEARRLAERLAGRAELDVTLSLAGRTAAPAAQPVPVRIGGFGGAAGARGLSVGGAHRRADRRHPSVCGCDLRQCRAQPRDRPACRCWRCGARPGSRPPATAGPRSPTCRRRLTRSAPRRAACFSRSAARSSRRSPARRSTIISSAASIRSSRRWRCRTRSMSPAAGRSAKPTIARCSKSIASRSWWRRTAAAPRPTARSRRRARSACR